MNFHKIINPTNVPQESRERRMAERRISEWCFTLHRYDGDGGSPTGPQRISDAADGVSVTYLCYQPEKCPTSGKKHLQGYICLSSKRTLKGVKDLIFGPSFSHVHLEPCKGTSEENRTYCSKEESRDSDASFAFVEHGDHRAIPARSGQGARNDISAYAAIIADGGSLYDAASENPGMFVRYYRGLGALQSTLFARPRKRTADGLFVRPDVHWYYGSTGSGKTRAVFDLIGDADYYSKPPGDLWFDGYTGQQILLLDDFRASWFTFGYLLRLLDSYPLQVAVKGGYVNFSAKTIYITAPRKPQDVYAGLEARAEGSIAQLTRRIHLIKLFGDEPPLVEVPVASLFNFN